MATLQVIDNQMDQTTGTIRIDAEFPNPNLDLWPGQFVNVRVLVDTLKQVVVVPVAAVQRGPNGTFVYVVDADEKANVRPVTIVQQDDTTAVVSDGVKADERVVTSGFTRLSNGTRVRVQAGEEQAVRTASPPRRRAKRRKAPKGPRARGTAQARRRRRARRRQNVERGERGEGKKWRKKQEGGGIAPRTPRATSNERLCSVHPAADRDLAARHRGAVRGRPRLHLAAGVGAAAGGFPVHSQANTQLPGASPDTMVALVTAPLERNFGQIPSLSTMTSSSSYGISQVTLQFDLNRDIDSAAQDVQAAINAAGSALPRNLPYPPVYSKVNPADTPIVTLALQSDTVSLRNLSDIADTLLAQRLSEISGVGQVSTQGGIKPAVRIQVDLPRLAAYGFALEDIRQAIVNANVAGAKGAFDGPSQSYTIAANDQLAAAEAYRTLVIAYRNGNPVMLRDVAEVVDGLENAKVAGAANGQPAVVIDIRRQPGANVVQTVQNIRNELPRLRRILPVGANLTIIQDRTDTIRASIHDVQFTLVLAVALVVLVVFIFLRTVRATIIAGVALPLSLIATFLVMWFAGFSLDNLSLMALTIGTGFVVDDAIVMIENIVRHMEEGASPFDAAMRGAREIGFTIISLTVSLIAVFIPLLFMSGLVGRMFREFALTLTIAVVVSQRSCR